MSRQTVFVLAAVTALILGAAAFGVLHLSAGARLASEPAPASEGAVRRQRAEQFFGGDPDRDVRGGQELKPRW